VEDQERTEQTPEEEKDVEGHMRKGDHVAAPEAARDDEGDDVEAHMRKGMRKY
jgi:hypothetical protein